MAFNSTSVEQIAESGGSAANNAVTVSNDQMAGFNRHAQQNITASPYLPDTQITFDLAQGAQGRAHRDANNQIGAWEIPVPGQAGPGGLGAPPRQDVDVPYVRIDDQGTFRNVNDRREFNIRADREGVSLIPTDHSPGRTGRTVRNDGTEITTDSGNSDRPIQIDYKSGESLSVGYDDHNQVSFLSTRDMTLMRHENGNFVHEQSGSVSPYNDATVQSDGTIILRGGDQSATRYTDGSTVLRSSEAVLVTDVLGRTEQFQFDAQGNAARVRQQGDGEPVNEQAQLDEFGNYAVGNTWFKRDGSRVEREGDQVTVTTPQRASGSPETVRTMQLDAAGNVTSVKEEVAGAVTFDSSAADHEGSRSLLGSIYSQPDVTAGVDRLGNLYVDKPGGERTVFWTDGRTEQYQNPQPLAPVEREAVESPL